MIGGVDRATLSAGVKFCHVNVSRWGNPPGRGRIRDTSNSRKIHFGGCFALLSKLTIESHSTEGFSKSNKGVYGALIAKTRGLSAFFLFACLATTQ